MLSMALPVIGIAGAGLAIHYCLTNAFRCGDAIVVIPMDFLRVPLIALIGWAFYGERLDAFVFAGAALIVGGVLVERARRSATQRDACASSDRRCAQHPAARRIGLNPSAAPSRR